MGPIGEALEDNVKLLARVDLLHYFILVNTINNT
jgi:hypothetical protein